MPSMPIPSLFCWQPLLVLLLLVLPTANLGVLDAPIVQDHMGQSWTLYRDPDGQSHIYKVFPLYMNFLEAETNCRQFYSHLASFHSLVEYEFIIDLVKSTNTSTTNKDFWLGLYNKNEDEILTSHKIYFVDGTDFVLWTKYQYYSSGSNPSTGSSNHLPGLAHLPETLFCMNYKFDRPVNFSTSPPAEEISSEVTIYSLPCNVKLNSHVCKLPVEKAIPVNSSTTSPRLTSNMPTLLEQEKTISYAPETEPLHSMGAIMDQWEKSNELTSCDVLPPLLLCTILVALLMLLCCCHFIRRFSKGRYKTGTYYPSEPKPQLHVSTTDYYTV